MRIFIYGLIFAGIVLLFANAVSAATYEGHAPREDGKIIFMFNDEKGPIACIQPHLDGEPVLCWRPGNVKYICKQEKMNIMSDGSAVGFISNCKREDW